MNNKPNDILNKIKNRHSNFNKYLNNVKNRIDNNHKQIENNRKDFNKKDKEINYSLDKMSRDLDDLLEAAFQAGYENAELDVMNEDAHPRQFARQFPTSGDVKHGRIADMYKKYNRQLKKLGVTNGKLVNPKNNKDKLEEKSKQLAKFKTDMVKSKKYKAYRKFEQKNLDKIYAHKKKKIEDFKSGKLKDLKSRLYLNHNKKYLKDLFNDN